MENKNAKKLCLFLIVIMLIASMAIILLSLLNKKNNTTTQSSKPTQQTENLSESVQKESSIIKVEKQISSETIEDGLKEMGVLVSEEYFFTNVISYSSVKKLWEMPLNFTETNYLATYDGVVTAGINMEGITVEKDDEHHEIRVTLPKSEIQNIDIDPKSFVLYSEKSGIGNPVSAEDFNDSLIELENTAKEKALKNGLLTRADENAKKIIDSFILSMVDSDQYKIVYK